MTITKHVRPALVASLLLACGVAPSRAPLGGNYALPESAPATDRHAPSEVAARPDAAASEPVTPVIPVATSSAMLSAVDSAAVPRALPADALHFEPLQVGSRLKAEVSLSTSFEIHGGPASTGKGKLSLDSRLRLEIKVQKASAQSLDEVELTLTTLSMHSDFDGQSADEKQGGSPQTYEIALTGSSPTIRTQRGAEVDSVERMKIAILIVPLAEFYAHWARSPTLELKPGWSSKVPLPFAATLFASAHSETIHIGPLTARFTSRSQASDDVPFELALPVEYGSGLGKISFDLTGSAKLNAKSG